MCDGKRYSKKTDVSRVTQSRLLRGTNLCLVLMLLPCGSADALCPLWLDCVCHEPESLALAHSTHEAQCALFSRSCCNLAHPTQVWALGCILYEIACLRKAFEAANIGGKH